MKNKVVAKDMRDVFKKPLIPANTSKKVGIWQVHPIKRGTKLFTETH